MGIIGCYKAEQRTNRMYKCKVINYIMLLIATIRFWGTWHAKEL